MTLTLTMTILILAMIGAGIVGFCIALLVRVLRLKRDNKPLTASLLIQHSPCSRCVGEYIEKYQSQATSEIHVWRNCEDGGVLKSENLTDEEAFKMLLSAVDEIGAKIGIKTAVIL